MIEDLRSLEVCRMPRLFHFSDDGSIDVFVPRPVSVPSKRAKGMEWLNGPLVWAIDEWHEPMYLFPRDCPRILLWPTERTTEEDRKRYFGASSARVVAYIEQSWLDRVRAQTLYRYEFSPRSFRSLDDAGMWVSRDRVRPAAVTRIEDLAQALAASGVDLRVLETLTPLRGVWKTSLHASGIRLRNARGWEP